METLERFNVKVGKDVYTLTAVECTISGAIALDLINGVLPIITSFADGDYKLLNDELRKSMSSKQLMDMFEQLVNVNLLEKNGDLVRDWKVEFSRKPATFFKLGLEALRFNCQDFFDFISGWLSEMLSGNNLKEIIQTLNQNGIVIPIHILQILPSSIQEAIQEIQQTATSQETPLQEMPV